MSFLTLLIRNGSLGLFEVKVDLFTALEMQKYLRKLNILRSCHGGGPGKTFCQTEHFFRTHVPRRLIFHQTKILIMSQTLITNSQIKLLLIIRLNWRVILAIIRSPKTGLLFRSEPRGLKLKKTLESSIFFPKKDHCFLIFTGRVLCLVREWRTCHSSLKLRHFHSVSNFAIIS